MATPEEQATIDAFTDLNAALVGLNAIITTLDAGGNAFDAATPAQRTAAIRLMARCNRAMAIILQGVKVPLGTGRVPG